MLTVADLQAWLPTLGVTTSVLDGYWIPPEPGRAVFVTLAGGPGPLYERLYDRVAVAVRCRGLQRQPADAEALAAQVDAAILAVVPPTTVGTTYVNDIDRAAPPRFAAIDKAFRAEFTATYLLTTAR